MSAPLIPSGAQHSNSYTNSAAGPSQSTDPVTDLTMPATQDVIAIRGAGQRISLSDIRVDIAVATQRAIDLIRHELEEAAGRLSPKATGAIAGAERVEIAKGAITGAGVEPLPFTTFDALMRSLEFLTNGPSATLTVSAGSREPDGTLGTGSESSNFERLFADRRPLPLAA